MDSSVGEATHTSSLTPDPSEQLSWKPLILNPAKLEALWDKAQSVASMFDDGTRGSKEHFVSALADKASAFYEVGDLTGLVSFSNIRPRIDAVFHIVMFDKVLKGRVPLIRDIIIDAFDRFALRRLSVVFPMRRTISIRLAKRLGFSQEGVLRKAYLFKGEYQDLMILGVLREEL